MKIEEEITNKNNNNTCGNSDLFFSIQANNAAKTEWPIRRSGQQSKKKEIENWKKNETKKQNRYS